MKNKRYKFLSLIRNLIPDDLLKSFLRSNQFVLRLSKGKLHSSNKDNQSSLPVLLNRLKREVDLNLNLMQRKFQNLKVKLLLREISKANPKVNEFKAKKLLRKLNLQRRQ